MNIIETHSHLNGSEFLAVRKPRLQREIEDIVAKSDSIMVLETFLHESEWEDVPTDSAQAIYLKKERSGIEFQTELASPYELFARHLAFYVGDQIDVGVVILPIELLRQQMSTDNGAFQQGRGVPAVPLVLIGVDSGE